MPIKLFGDQIQEAAGGERPQHLQGTLEESAWKGPNHTFVGLECKMLAEQKNFKPVWGAKNFQRESTSIIWPRAEKFRVLFLAGRIFQFKRLFRQQWRTENSSCGFYRFI